MTVLAHPDTRPLASADRQATPPPSRVPERIPALDGIRGIAILLVMLFHFTAVSLVASTRADDIFAQVAGAGWAGVDLFFVLSGFLITGILYDSKARVGRYFGTFYARRFLRIFPAYYGMLLFLLFALPLIGIAEPGVLDSLRERQIWYWAYLANVRSSLHPGITGDWILTGHLWSLAVEEQFYLAWPLIVFLFPRRVLMGICVLGIGGALAFRMAMHATGGGPDASYTLMVARMDALMVGALVALAVRHPGDFRWWLRFIAPAGLAAVGGGLWLFFSRGGLSPFDAPVQAGGFLALAVAFGGIVTLGVVAPTRGPVHWMLGRGVLPAFGRYSYALYLVHWPVATLLSRNTGLADAAPVVNGSHIPGALLFMAVAGSGCFAGAWLSWRLFESQVLKLKRFFPYGERKRQTSRVPEEFRRTHAPAPPPLPSAPIPLPELLLEQSG